MYIYIYIYIYIYMTVSKYSVGAWYSTKINIVFFRVTFFICLYSELGLGWEVGGLTLEVAGLTLGGRWRKMGARGVT